jgi:hypothetical protein
MKDKEAPTFEIKVQNHDLLALRNMIKERKYITRKLQRLPHLRNRLEIENPDVSIQELVDRLIQKKDILDKEILKYNNFSKAKRSSSAQVGENFVFVKRAPLGPSLDLDIDQIMKVREGIEFIYPFWRTTCPILNGTTMLFLPSWGMTNSDLNSINHNSSADYEVDHVSYFLGELDYEYNAWLNDDASLWRNDNPDRHNWYDHIHAYLPTPECDSRVVASVKFRSSGRILSEADDHNEIEQTVYVAHSDENGILPASVSFGDQFDVIDFDLSGEIGLPGGNNYDSGWYTADMSFNVNSGVMPQIAIAAYTELTAQDGVLEILGNWEFQGLTYRTTPN